MRTLQHYVLLLLLVYSLVSCDTKKVAAGQNDIVEVELSEREQELMEEKMHLDSLNETLQWKEIRDNLYINKDGDLGFKTASFRPNIEWIDFYITNFKDEEKKAFKDIIDVKSFKLIGGDSGWGGYYKDKNHIYHFFSTSDGGTFYIVKEADYATFEIMQDCYARDINHIYDMRDGLMREIDVATFKTLYLKKRCLGKDKNGYYWGNNKLSDEELAAPEMQEFKKKLDKL